MMDRPAGEPSQGGGLFICHKCPHYMDAHRMDDVAVMCWFCTCTIEIDWTGERFRKELKAQLEAEEWMR